MGMRWQLADLSPLVEKAIYIGQEVKTMHNTTNTIEKKSITNGERIRNMDNEELAWELMTWRIETIAKHHGTQSNYPDTQVTILEWLNQIAE